MRFEHSPLAVYAINSLTMRISDSGVRRAGNRRHGGADDGRSRVFDAGGKILTLSAYFKNTSITGTSTGGFTVGRYSTVRSSEIGRSELK